MPIVLSCRPLFPYANESPTIRNGRVERDRIYRFQQATVFARRKILTREALVAIPAVMSNVSSVIPIEYLVQRPEKVRTIEASNICPTLMTSSDLSFQGRRTTRP